MKTIPMFLLVILSAMTINAQSAYAKGMTKAFQYWSDNEPLKACQLFERISTVEKKEWLPAYYVATIEIITSFGLKDESKLDAKLKKAQRFLEKAAVITPNNPEIIITEALLNTAYIAFDGQKYGMTLSGKNISLYEKALKIAPNNPRVVLGKAEWDMGTARFFGQSTSVYCDQIVKAITLFETEELPKFYPSKGKKRAQRILEQCENRK